MNKKFKLWAISDAHVGTDIKYGRESLAEAILQSENSFDWDVCLNLGDFSGSQIPPDDEEGLLVVEQYKKSKKHKREDFYDLIGNHDATRYGDKPVQWWFRKWIDPIGENTSYSGVNNLNRNYPVSGTWEHYSFDVGNITFLMLADRNDYPPPRGRGEKGGYPAGTISDETFEWWKSKVIENQGRIIITCAHHMLKETTVATGYDEGCDGGYHGRFTDGAPRGASFIYFIGEEEDSNKIDEFLKDKQSPKIDIWLGAHTHTHPDDIINGRSHIEKKYDVNFINVAGLTKYHGKKSVPMSRLFTFEEGSKKIKVSCFLHTSDYSEKGWYLPAESTLTLSENFLF